jgi:hypothetical protein
MEKFFDQLADWITTTSDPTKLGITAVVFVSLTLAALGFYRFVWAEPVKFAAPSGSTLPTSAAVVKFVFENTGVVTVNMNTKVIGAGDQRVQLQTGSYATPSGGNVGFTVYVAYAGSP